MKRIRLLVIAVVLVNLVLLGLASRVSALNAELAAARREAAVEKQRAASALSLVDAAVKDVEVVSQEHAERLRERADVVRAGDLRMVAPSPDPDMISLFDDLL